MYMFYDNWERLVAAVVKREEIWQLCHQPSRSPSICSESSDFSSSSFRLSDKNLQTKDESVEKPVPKLAFLGGSTPGIPQKGALKGAVELGKGTYGTSVLTQLLQDVKVSDKEFLVTEEEFKEQMMIFGNCRHENVGAPRAYYFSNEADGIVIVNDYHRQGSVSHMLHEKGALNASPNWKSRLRIAIGAARGIAHIHTQCGGKMAHGNIKSSNIFLNSQLYGCVSEFSLAGIMKKPPVLKGVGYHAALYFKSVSQEMDVYNFGNFLLELLTGKSPLEAQGFAKDLELVAWVRSIKSQEYWTSKLFDQSLRSPFRNEKDLIEMEKTEIPGFDLVVKESVIDLKALRATLGSHFHSMARIPSGYFRAQELMEMEEMLQVAMRCLVVFPKDRPKMCDVVLMLENIASVSDGKPQQTQNSSHPDEKELSLE